MEPIQIRMLGEFSLSRDGHVIRETDKRSRRSWQLLSYLLCHRGQTVSQQKLISLLWDSDSGVSNPENALRILLHRTRALLDQLYPGTGRQCIVYTDGGYLWNPDVPIRMDWERFDQLCGSTFAGEEARLEALLEALSLYQGEFLPRQSSDSWVIPLVAHFQNRYLLAAQEASGLLAARGRYREASDICRRAIAAEPYFEPIYQALMQNLAAMGDPKGAAQVYEDLSRRLFDDFGIRPSEESRAVYRAAAHSPEDRTLPMDEILEHLQEPEPLPGALLCDYDYFKVLCYAESRAMERRGTVAHVALLSLTASDGKPLSKRSRTRIMEQLGQTLRTNLRRGDVISQCSISQYIFLLSGANYENSCMVCRRVLAAFQKAHPHVTARIHYMVQPLTPSVCIP